MPKLVSVLVRAQIALLNPLLKRIELPTMRKLQDGLGALGQKALAGAVHYADAAIPGLDAAWAVPASELPGKAILYLHGGAYTAGSLPYAKGFGGVLAELTERRVLCVGYRLAPEHPFPAALDDALAAYRAMLKAYPPSDIAFVGESAGGGLCYSLAMACRDGGLPMPCAIVALSPWADLTMNAPGCAEQRETDPVLNLEGLRYSASLYAGDADLAQPLISPVYGNLAGMPPSLIIAGSDELLLPDSLTLSERLREAGGRCTLQIGEGMWHVYALYGIPEAREALSQVRTFLSEVMADGPA